MEVLQQEVENRDVTDNKSSKEIKKSITDLDELCCNNPKLKRILELRFQGYTLEKIATTENVTKESIRGRINKGLSSFPILKEDSMAFLFMEYEMTKEFFCFVFGDETVYYYLKERYNKIPAKKTRILQKSDDGIIKLLEDERISDEQKAKIQNYARIKYDSGQIIDLSGYKLLIYIMKEHYSDTDVSISELRDVYVEALKSRNDTATKIPKTKAIEERLRRDKDIVCGRNHRARYRECTLDDGLIAENIISYKYNNSEVSTKILFQENKEYCDAMDIKNEHELHFLMRRNYGDSFIVNGYLVKMGKSPIICIGMANRMDQYQDLKKETLSKNIPLAYERKYGISQQTIRAWAKSHGV